ncbi:hypothetical protein DITRI_Ditri07aG0008500 [Diplodiscus trichospermus]
MGKTVEKKKKKGKTIATGEENGSCSLEISSVLPGLVEKYESRLNLLDNSQNVASGYCIFRIPAALIKEKKSPYRPQYARIGPLVYYVNISTHKEDQKKSYLASFLFRVKHRTRVEDFILLIIGSLAKIRGCYEKIYYRYQDRKGKIRQNKPVSHESDSLLLIEMILVDAGFILELLLRDYYSKEWRVENDIIFAKSGMLSCLKQELMLLQNQLPFFLLRDIYQLAFSDNPDYPDFPPFLHLTCHFFSHYYNQKIPLQDVLSKKNPHPEYRSKLEETKHFTDLVRTFQQPYSFKKHSINEESQRWKSIIRAKQYFMDLISQKPKEKELEEILEEGKMQGDYLYSAILLLETGVKFKVSLGRCLFDIEFDQRNGELKIPPLKVDNSTESFYGNLMVWEQCYYPNDTFICDYILLMEYLIKSVKDVDLLVRRRIIVNQLGSPDAIVALFNRLSKHIRVEKNRYSDLFMKLNAYNAVRHHGWIAILKLQYFSTPWKGVATIAATILLVLTLIQTICAVISL